MVDGAWVGAAEGCPVLAVGLALGRSVTGAVVGGAERSTHSTRAVGAGVVLNCGATAEGSHHLVPVTLLSRSHCISAVLQEASSGGVKAEDAVYASSPPETDSAAPDER